MPLSMTTAGRAVASMAGGSGESPHAHAGVARWRSIGGRDRTSSPGLPNRTGLAMRRRVADPRKGSGSGGARAGERGIEREREGGRSWSAGEIWGGGRCGWRGVGEGREKGDGVIWLTGEAGRKQTKERGGCLTACLGRRARRVGRLVWLGARGWERTTALSQHSKTSRSPASLAAAVPAPRRPCSMPRRPLPFPCQASLLRHGDYLLRFRVCRRGRHDPQSTRHLARRAPRSPLTGAQLFHGAGRYRR